MAFTVITNGDPVNALTAMANWRHVNFGNTLLPVNATGSGVNNTIDLGSTTYKFKDGHFAGTIAGTLSTAAQTNITSLGTLTGLQTSGNVGIGRAATVNLDVYKATGFVEFFLEGADTAEGVSSTFKNDNSKNISIACFGSTNSGSYDGLSYADATRISTNGDFLLLAQDGNTPIYFGTNSNVRMSIDGSGNVVVNDGNLTLSTGSFIGAISGNTTVTQTSGDLTFNLNNDSHGDNSILQFNAEDGGGTNKTCNLTWDPDLLNFVSDRTISIGVSGTPVLNNGFKAYINSASDYGLNIDNSHARGYGVRITTATTDGSDPVFTAFANGSIAIGIYGDRKVFLPGVYDDDINGDDYRALLVKDDGQLGYDSSTARKKTNIVDMENVDWIYTLRPVNFNYRKKDDSGAYTEQYYKQKKYGFIAEELEKVASEFVFYDENGKPEGIHYREMISPLVKAVQEQKKEINYLKGRLN